jgi:hypothetical protein
MGTHIVEGVERTPHVRRGDLGVKHLEGLLRAVEAPVYDYYEPNRSFYERIEAAVRSKLGEATFERAVVEGRTMDFDQAVEYALEDEEASPN